MTERYTDYHSNPFFKESELLCRCGSCKETAIHPELMAKLITARRAAKTPFVITSGCRCPEHNKAVGGSANSDHLYRPLHSSSLQKGGKGGYGGQGKDDTTQHLLCQGIDILCTDNITRFIITKALLDAGINRIGLHPRFIHAAIDKRNPGNVIWFY